MISIHIPKGKHEPNINKEIMSARNIKDKKIRDRTISGLNKISQYL